MKYSSGPNTHHSSHARTTRYIRPTARPTTLGPGVLSITCTFQHLLLCEDPRSKCFIHGGGHTFVAFVPSQQRRRVYNLNRASGSTALNVTKSANKIVKTRKCGWTKNSARKRNGGGGCETSGVPAIPCLDINSFPMPCHLILSGDVTLRSP